MKVIAIMPKLFDYLVSSIIEGLYKNNVEVIASEKGNNIKRIYSKKEIIQHAKTADYILVFRGKVKGNIPPKYFLLDKINRPEVTAFIDGSEWNFSGIPEKYQIIESYRNPSRRRGKKWINKMMFNYCESYFKRECYPMDEKKGIIPLLYAAEDNYFGNYDCSKTIDVFCSFGQKNSGLRYNVIKICKKLKREGYNIVIKSSIPYEEYKRLISSSYISIDAWGGGDCTARLWEIIANKSCCFSQKYNIIFPNNFTDGYNYVEYTNIKEFEKKLRFYLKNKEECLKVAERGYQHLIQYHTSNKRAEDMLKHLKQDLKKQKKPQIKKTNVGKKLYIYVIIYSFIRNPKYLIKFIYALFRELKSRIT